MMYAVVLDGLRLSHRRTLAQWTAIDFAAAVAVGAILGRTAVAESQALSVGVVALVTVLGMHWIVTMARYDRRFAALAEHQVRLLVRDGRICQKQLRRSGLTKDDLHARLRQQGIRSVADVRYVLYETKGDLTIVHERGQVEDG